MLEQSPYDVPPDKLKDICVWGTMVEGRVQPVPVGPKPGGTKPSKLGAKAPGRQDAAVPQAAMVHVANLMNHNHDH